MKEFFKENWKWLVPAIGVVVAASLIFDLLGLLYGAGLSVVAWFSTQQVRKVKEDQADIQAKLTDIRTRMSVELATQVDADESLELTAQIARDEVNDTWDDAAILPRPGLDD